METGEQERTERAGLREVPVEVLEEEGSAERECPRRRCAPASDGTFAGPSASNLTDDSTDY